APDGKYLAGHAAGVVVVWEVASGKEFKRFGGAPMAGAAPTLGFSPDGRAVFSRSGTELLRMGGLGTSKMLLRTLKAHRWAFSNDGRLLATCSLDGTVKLFDAKTGKEKAQLKGHTGQVWSVDFSADGKLLASGSADGTVKLWDTDTGAEKESIKGRGPAVFSPDGKLLAMGTASRPAKLWDVAARKEVALLKGHLKAVSHLEFSADGKTLASKTPDARFDYRVWDVAGRRQLFAVTDSGTILL